MLRLVFFCSGDFPVPTLEYFIKNKEYDVVGIVGNHYNNVFNDTHITDISNDNNIPMINSYMGQDEDTLCNWLKDLNPDMFVVISYRKLPNKILEIPKIATFNVHASILPFLGGSAPINWAIINGFTKTGLTSFLLNDKIDTGNIILNKECDIEETDDFKSLFLKLSEMCVKFTENTVLKLLKLRLNNDSFDSSLMYNPYDIFASNVKRFIYYKDITPFVAPKLTALNTRISWKDSASNIHNFVRGLSPLPGAHTVMSVHHSYNNEERQFKVKILETEVLSSDILPNNCIPADNLSNIYTDKKKCLYFIDTFPLTNEILSIKKIQLQNKKVMDIKAFLNGFRGFEKYNGDDCLTIKFI